MSVKAGILTVLVTFMCFGGVAEVSTKTTSAGSAPKRSSVIYHGSSQVSQDAGKAEDHVAQETQSHPRGRRQSYSYGGTQRPVSYNEEYHSPPYYYESNSPPQSYYREYHHNSPPQHYSRSYNSGPQQHSSSYNHHDSNEHDDPYHRGGDSYGHNDDDGGDYGQADYENSPSNRYEREIRGDPTPQEEYTGRINLDY